MGKSLNGGDGEFLPPPFFFKKKKKKNPSLVSFAVTGSSVLAMPSPHPTPSRGFPAVCVLTAVQCSSRRLKLPRMESF